MLIRGSSYRDALCRDARWLLILQVVQGVQESLQEQVRRTTVLPSRLAPAPVKQEWLPGQQERWWLRQVRSPSR